MRLDATTVSGYHAGGEDSLFQFGYSKDDPTLKQVSDQVIRHVTPLTDLQVRILEWLGLSIETYTHLVHN